MPSLLREVKPSTLNEFYAILSAFVNIAEAYISGILDSNVIKPQFL
jgi:hypothetical protein